MSPSASHNMDPGLTTLKTLPAQTFTTATRTHDNQHYHHLPDPPTFALPTRIKLLLGKKRAFAEPAGGAATKACTSGAGESCMNASTAAAAAAESPKTSRMFRLWMLLSCRLAPPIPTAPTHSPAPLRLYTLFVWLGRVVGSARCWAGPEQGPGAV